MLGSPWECLGGLGSACKHFGALRSAWDQVGLLVGEPVYGEFVCWPEPGAFCRSRNPEESGEKTGIPVPQEFLQKNPVKAAENRNFQGPLQNHIPVNKFLRKKQEKKEILRNPGRNRFWGSKKKFTENRNMQPSSWLQMKKDSHSILIPM